jgi:hypothetical protein
MDKPSKPLVIESTTSADQEHVSGSDPEQTQAVFHPETFLISR